MDFVASCVRRARSSESWGQATAALALFSGVFASGLLVAFLLVLFSPTASAACAICDACGGAGQTCQQDVGGGCHRTLSCGCTSTSYIQSWVEEEHKDCFCLSRLEINAMYDGSHTAEDSSIGLLLSVSQGSKTFYTQREQLVTTTTCAFTSASNVWCPPPRPRDPPVACRLYLTGPGVVNQLVATKTIDADPGNTYLDSITIPSVYLQEPGKYTASLDCGIQLPQGSVECVSSCSHEFRQVSFGVHSCTPVVSVETGKAEYSNGDVIAVSGTFKNDNAAASASIRVSLIDEDGATVASTVVQATGGSYSASFPTSQLSSGNYRVVAEIDSFGLCPDSQASATAFVSFTKCAISLAANVPQAAASGVPFQISGTVTNDGSGVPARVLVTTRSNGADIGSQEVFADSNGAFSVQAGPLSNGYYSAEISANYESCPAKTASRNFEVECGLSVSAQATKDSYASGDRIIIEGSLASGGDGAEGAYTIIIRDAAGSVVAQKSGESQANGDFSEEFASLNLAPGAYTAAVQANAGQCAARQATVQFSISCDISASVLQLPKCYGNDAEFYVIRVDNNKLSENPVQVTYTSPLQLVGPASVYMNASEARLFNFTVNAAEDLNGQTVGLVDVVGSNPACTKKLQFPICLRGKISIEAVEDTKTSHSGRTACFPVILRNRGADSAIVSLSSSRLSGQNAFSGYFNVPKVKLSPYEIRDDLRFCADVPRGDTGTHSFSLRGQSAINDDSDEVYLTVSDDYDEDYLDEHAPDDTYAPLSPSSVSLACNSQSSSTLRVKNTGSSTMNYSFSAPSGIFNVSFSPSALSLAPNSESTVAITVMQKAATSAGTYSVPITIYRSYPSGQYSDQQASIDCGDGNQAATTACSPASGVCSATCHYSGSSGSRILSASLRGTLCAQTQVAVGPVSACTLSASPNSFSTGGTATVSVDYKNLGYAPSSVSVNCGNGNTATANGCTGTSGSCVAQCTYPNSGVYTISASASGQYCAQTQAAVGSTGPWCALLPSSKFIDSSGSTTVSLYYQNIPPYAGVYYGQQSQATYSAVENFLVTVPACSSPNYGARLSYVGGTVTGTQGSQGTSGALSSVTPTPAPTPAPSSQLPVAISLQKETVSYSIETEVFEASYEFVVSNPANASGSLFLSGGVLGLPSGWNVSVSAPANGIAPGANATFSANVSARGFEKRDYEAVFEARDSTGNVKQFPFKVRAGEASSPLGILSGLFTAGTGGFESLLLFAIIVLFFSAAFLIRKAGKNFEEAGKRE
ncbi:MAG: hypothetical protein WC792_00430 [Candidatus Micrarchaeia archaeon]|jgi:hypothetical protein